MQVWPPHLLLQKTKCRYSPPTYYFNSSRSIYRSPSYDQFFKYQCSSIYCTTIVHVKRDLLQCQKRPTTSFASINVAASIVQHPLANCRLYYSPVTVCVSLFYVIDTGSIRPRARILGDRDGGYLSTLRF